MLNMEVIHGRMKKLEQLNQKVNLLTYMTTQNMQLYEMHMQVKYGSNPLKNEEIRAI